jgi:hypothetical protein
MLAARRVENAAAAALDRRGIKGACGAHWHPEQVAAVLRTSAEPQGDAMMEPTGQSLQYIADKLAATV